MKITLLCSDANHPVNAHINRWIEKNQSRHNLQIVRESGKLSGGDFLFLISCTEIISPEKCALYNYCLVLHASDLPSGKGWSPHIWELIGGAPGFTLSLLEAAEALDSGDIWSKVFVEIPKDALWDEINDKLFEAEISMLDFAINHHKTITPRKQVAAAAPCKYWPKRSPGNSCVKADDSIAKQFDLLRTCDPTRYPAYVDHLGCRYKITLEKIINASD